MSSFIGLLTATMTQLDSPTPLREADSLSRSLLVLLLVALPLAVVAAFSERNDFHFFVCALSVLKQGGAVYGGSGYAICVDAAMPGGPPVPPFPYPPTVFSLLSPLQLAAQSLWRPIAALLSVLFAAGAVAWSGRSYGLTPLVTVMVALLFGPLLFSIAIGHLSPFFLLALTATVALRNSSLSTARFFAGGALAVFVVKPHLVYLAGVALIVEAVRRRNWSYLAGVLVAGAVAVSAPLIFSVSIYSEWLRFGLTSGSVWYTPTIPTALTVWLGLPASVATVVSLSIGALWCAWAVGTPRARQGGDLVVFEMVAVSLMTVPYVWPYDYSLLLPALFLFLGSGKLSLRRVSIVVVAEILSLTLLVSSPYPGMENLALPLACGIGLAAVRLVRTPPTSCDTAVRSSG